MHTLKHALIVVCSSAAGLSALAFGAAMLWSSAPDQARAAGDRSPAAEVQMALLRPAAPVAAAEPAVDASGADLPLPPDRSGTERPDLSPSAAGGQPAAPQSPRAHGSGRPATAAGESFVGVLLPEHAADIAAQQAGLVRELHVALGEVVERDQLLVSLAVDQAALDHTRSLAEREAARAALARARIEHAHAADEARRSERLAQEGLTTKEALSQARFKRNQTRVLAAEAEAYLRERSARAEQLAALRDQGAVVASFRGRVAARYVSAGSLVGAGTPLVRLISDDAVLVRFAVPEHVAGLAAGRKVRLVPNEQPELRFEARIVRVSPEIDAASRMRTVEALPADPRAVVERGLVGAIVAVSMDEAASRATQAPAVHAGEG